MGLTYLNHASETPLRPAVRDRMVEYLNAAMFNPDAVLYDQRRCRELLASLIGATTAEIALMPNTTLAISLVVNGLDWRPGDNVVLEARQFPANSWPWLMLQDRGVDVRLVPAQEGRGWTPAALGAQIDPRTRAVAVSSVDFDTGFRGDLVQLGRLCRDQGALFVVDAIQSAGAVPHDVVAECIDVLAAGGYKWLMGPVGCGFAFVRHEVQDRLWPVAPGAWASAVDFNLAGDELQLYPDARRFEGGNLAWPAFHGWTAGLEELVAAGIANVWAQIWLLTDRLIAGLQAQGCQLISPLAPAARSGIVACSLGTPAANATAQARLLAEGVVVAVRRGHLRISPHFLNNTADIDRFLDRLAG